MIKGLLIFGALQGFVFSIALLSIRTPKSVATNRLFSFLIFIVSLFLLISSQTRYFANHPKFFLTTFILVYLYCPVYYLFTESLTIEEFKFKRSHWLLMMPSVLYLIALGPYFFMSTEEILHALRQRDFIELSAIDFVSIALNIFILWKCWIMMRHRHNISIPYAKEWAFAVLNFVLLITNIAWLSVILPQFGILENFAAPFTINTVYITMSVTIFVFGYVLVIRADHFSIYAVAQNIQYRNVNMDETLVKTVEQKILEAIESTKPYKRTNFSLDELSKLMGVDKVKISYTINKSMNTNFTSLVNRYRVQEFIQLVNSDEFSNFSILGIATEAGFSSKSTFYKAFKEITGQTPVEYFKDHRQADLKSA